MYTFLYPLVPPDHSPISQIREESDLVSHLTSPHPLLGWLVPGKQGVNWTYVHQIFFLLFQDLLSFTQPPFLPCFVLLWRQEFFKKYSLCLGAVSFTIATADLATYAAVLLSTVLDSTLPSTYTVQIFILAFHPTASVSSPAYGKVWLLLGAHSTWFLCST